MEGKTRLTVTRERVREVLDNPQGYMDALIVFRVYMEGTDYDPEDERYTPPRFCDIPPQVAEYIEKALYQMIREGRR